MKRVSQGFFCGCSWFMSPFSHPRRHMEELMQEVSKIVIDICALWKSQLLKTQCWVPHVCRGKTSWGTTAVSPDGEVIQRPGREEGFSRLDKMLNHNSRSGCDRSQGSTFFLFCNPTWLTSDAQVCSRLEATHWQKQRFLTNNVPRQLWKHYFQFHLQC